MTENHINDQNFEFNLLLKGKEGEDGERYVYGICSSESLDTDNAIVESSGLKKSAEWFLKNGIIDYDHRSQTKGEPGAIIGKPLQLEWDDTNKAHFKGKLYKGIKKADEVWDLIQAGGDLGFSVGGKILENKKVFDPKLNKNITKISKVFLNHMAITPFPANKDTMVTNKSYATFFKSLSAKSDFDEQVYDELMNQETKRIEELKKMMVATGNDNSSSSPEATGGVKEGGNVLVKESLEANPKVFDQKKKKKKILTKNFSIEFLEDDTVVINMNDESEAIQDKELTKHDDIEKEKIAEAYMDILKSMSEGNKEVLDIDNYLKKNSFDLNRRSRRIIKRHLSKKVAEILKSNEELRKKYGMDGSYRTINESFFNANTSAYKKDGVVYGAQEDREYIPVEETSIPSFKQFSKLSIEDKIYEEGLCLSEPTNRRIIERINEIDYELITDEELFNRFNNIRVAYGKEILSKELFEDNIKENRWSIISIVKDYDVIVKEQLEKVIKKLTETINKPLDNGNLTHTVISTKVKDISDTYRN